MSSKEDLINIKPDVTKIFVIGSAPSLDMYDLSKIDTKNSIIITMNATIGLFNDTTDIQVVMDSPPVMYYRKLGTEKTIWMGRKSNESFLQKHKPNNYVLCENVLGVNGAKFGSGSASIELAVMLYKERKNIKEIHIIGIDFITINLKKTPINYTYSHTVKPFLFKGQQQFALPKIGEVGRKAKQFQITPKNKISHYSKQAVVVAQLFQREPEMYSDIIKNHTYCDYEQINLYDHQNMGFPHYIREINPSITVEELQLKADEKIDIVYSNKYSNIVKGKKGIVVGPAPYLKEKNLAELIDSFDFVIRLNHGITAPPEYGTKTNIWFLNSDYVNNCHTASEFVEIVESRNIELLVSKNALGLKKLRPYTEKIIQVLNDYSLMNKIHATFLNMGVFAILYTLKYKPRELHFVGFDFYSSKVHYYENYSEGRASDIVPNKFLLTHNQGKHKKIVKRVLNENKNLFSDKRLYDIVGVKGKKTTYLG